MQVESDAESIPYVSPLPPPSGSRIEGQSMRNRLYRLRADRRGDEFSIHEIMEVRNLLDQEEQFLNPRIDRDLPDPSTFADMDKAAKRLADAVMWKEKVVIFGDYDVDGASSSAIMGRWLREVGGDFSVYIPDRMREGYGPSDIAFSRVLDMGVNLILCVDCGTAAHGPIDKANEAGVDVLVVDHHTAQGDLPDAVAVVNPHRSDCRSGMTMMCAAGLAFMLVVATQRELRQRKFFKGPEPKLKDLLDIVALATVADIVPLIGPSRMFVAKGLEVMATNPSPGLRALIEVSRPKKIDAGSIGFALGPRINAGGRLGAGSMDADGALGAKLLMAATAEEADHIAETLNRMNAERQSVEKGCSESAHEEAIAQVAAGRKSIVVAGDGWHPGVVGIVASRIKDRHDKPTIVGGIIDGKVKASGRSMAGLNLGGIVIEAKSRGMLIAGGGHAMACGLTCEIGRWEEFKEFLESRIAYEPQPLPVDLEVHHSYLTIDSVAGLDAMQPLGQGMPGVCIAVSGLKVGDFRPIGEGHGKVTLQDGRTYISALWWGAGKDGFDVRLKELRGREVIAIGTPSINEFNGRSSVQIVLDDLIPA